MNLLKIKTTKTKIKINLDLRGFDNIPFFQNQDNKFDFELALKDAIKYEADKFSSYQSSNEQFYINDGPFYLQSSNEKNITEFSNILESINNNAEKIWNNFNSSIKNLKHPQEDNLNTFIELLYKALFNEVIEYNKNKELKFFYIHQEEDSINVFLPFYELFRIDDSLPQLFRNVCGNVIHQEFKNIAQIYYPDVQLSIIKHPSLHIQSNDTDCLKNLMDVLDKINNQSRSIYEIALHQIDEPLIMKEDDLVDKLTDYLSSFIATEALDSHMPLNNNTDKKKLKI